MNINIILLGIVSFLTDISSEIILPILPFFITALGGTGLAIGLIGGISDALASILKVFSGYLSDRIGKRRTIVASGYFISAMSKFILPYSPNWGFVLFARMLDRVGKGIRTSPRDAMIADYSKKSVRGKAFGFHRALDTAGAVIGSIIALILIYFYKLNEYTLIFVYKKIFLLAAFIAFLALVPLSFTREPKLTPTKINLHALLGEFNFFTLIASIFSVSNFSYMFYILRAQQYFLKKFSVLNATGVTVGLYILFNIIYAGLAFPSGKLSDKIGRKSSLLIGYMLYFVTASGFAFADSLPVFVTLFIIYGAAFAFIEGIQRALAADLAVRHGTGLGVFHMSIGIASFTGSIIAGILWQFTAPKFTFIFGAIVSLIAILLFTFGKSESSKV